LKPLTDSKLAEILGVSEQEVTKIPEDQVEDLSSAVITSGKEGALKLYKHYKRERKSGLARGAKNNFKKKYGRIFCEACKIEPESLYGVEIIEAHHRIPLSKSALDRETTVDDFLLLCPSCHRAIHKISDCNFDELKRLVGRTKQ